MHHAYSPEAIHAAAVREFQAHRHFLWALCYRMTGSAADADDLVEETFVRALERPPLSARGGWQAWLTRVAANVSIDALRLRKRREYIGPWLPAPIETADAASPPDPEILSSDLSSGPRYDLIESVSVAFLLALENLTPRQRAVLILRDVFNYSVLETAKALDLTQSNVKATQLRSRQAMAAYEEGRAPPTRNRQAQTADRLREFLTHLQNQDVVGVEAMLAKDARALSDAGGEFHAARQPVIGRRNVARMLLRLAAKRAGQARLSFRMLNGMPALVAVSPAPKGYAQRFVLQIDLDPTGAIAAVHSVLATRKLLAVSFET
jgi:RNA polymerase sigma-70 factor (ECF subfamily)